MKGKRTMQLVLSKETLRVLIAQQMPKIVGGAPGGTVTTTLDPDCFDTRPSYYKCP